MTSTDLEPTDITTATHRPTNDSSDETTPDDSGAKLTVVVHDGDGTWFSPGSLQLVALNEEALDELLSGYESVLNEYEGVDLLPLLRRLFAHQDDLTWE